MYIYIFMYMYIYMYIIYIYIYINVGIIDTWEAVWRWMSMPLRKASCRVPRSAGPHPFYHRDDLHICIFLFIAYAYLYRSLCMYTNKNGCIVGGTPATRFGDGCRRRCGRLPAASPGPPRALAAATPPERESVRVCGCVSV